MQNNPYVKNALPDYAKCLYQTKDLSNLWLFSWYYLWFDNLWFIKLYMIHLTERYMVNNNNKIIEALQRHVGLLMLILSLLSYLVYLSHFVFDVYFSAATCFFNLVLFNLLCSFDLSI